MKKLPHAGSARVEEKKIRDYLLNLNHPDGKSKAQFFQARGFSATDWECMRDALVAQGQNNLVVKETPTDWGIRYQVDCHCPTPDGVNPCIRSVWECSCENDFPRLLTAHPLPKR